MRRLKKKPKRFLSRETETSVIEDSSVEVERNFSKYTSMSSESFASESRGRLFNITELSGISAQVQTPHISPNLKCFHQTSDIVEEEEVETLHSEVEELESPCTECSAGGSPARVDLSEVRYQELSRNIQRLESKFETLIALLQQQQLGNASTPDSKNSSTESDQCDQSISKDQCCSVTSVWNAISFPEPANFLRRMLDQNEGSGKDQYLGEPDWLSEIQYNKSAICGLLGPVLSRALRFRRACAVRS